jgi:type IV pilus assembly protein PilC
VSLSFRQKSVLYRELGQLARSGKPLPAAIQLLQSNNSGAVRKLLDQLRAALDRGKSVGDAFSSIPEITHLEASIIAASERTGKLDQGCLYLSNYYEQLWVARTTVIKKLLYPAFILHLGIFVTGLPALVLNYNLGSPGKAVEAYLKGSIGVLILIYFAALILWIVGIILATQGSLQPAVDRFLRMIPLFGKLRRAYALSRFCATYEMQLQSGVNVMDSLESAGKASQSAMVNAAVKKAVPLVRGGAQVGPLLQGNDAFTEEMVRTIQIGEETGELDAELKRLAIGFQQEATSRLEFFAAFLFKSIYMIVLIYVGVRLIFGYLGYIDAAIHSVDSMQ